MVHFTTPPPPPPNTNSKSMATSLRWSNVVWFKLSYFFWFAMNFDLFSLSLPLPLLLLLLLLPLPLLRAWWTNGFKRTYFVCNASVHYNVLYIISWILFFFCTCFIRFGFVCSVYRLQFILGSIDCECPMTKLLWCVNW